WALSDPESSSEPKDSELYAKLVLGADLARAFAKVKRRKRKNNNKSTTAQQGQPSKLNECATACPLDKATQDA
ncbi:unnamed protein product, partial [Amoebophrya sp. A25]